MSNILLTNWSRLIILDIMMTTVKKKASEAERQISVKVRALMEQAGLSARKLGQKIGLENIYRVLDGERNWSFKHLLAVSDLFGVPLEELVGGNNLYSHHGVDFRFRAI